MKYYIKRKFPCGHMEQESVSKKEFLSTSKRSLNDLREDLSGELVHIVKEEEKCLQCLYLENDIDD